MTRTLFDSTTVSDIPPRAKMVAGYIDGNYKTVDALRRRFPDATVVTITVLGTPGAHVCDTEPGNIGIKGAVRWAKNEVDAGRKPTIYCMASVWPSVKRAVSAAGIKGQVSYWIADYDGDPTIPRGAVAKQYANPPLTGGHYDVSSVAADWPGVDPDPKPPVVKPPAKATRLSPLVRFALRLIIRRLNARKHAVAQVDRPLLTKAQLAEQSALGIKER